MRNEWYLVRYLGEVFIDKSPHSLNKREAENLLSLANQDAGRFTYKVEHRSKFK